MLAADVGLSGSGCQLATGLGVVGVLDGGIRTSALEILLHLSQPGSVARLCKDSFEGSQDRAVNLKGRVLGFESWNQKGFIVKTGSKKGLFLLGEIMQ